MFDLINRLIREHGSSSILRDHLDLIRSKYESLDTENQQLKSALEHAELDVKKLQTELRKLQSRLNNLICDHCASPNITRIGTRPHQEIGEVGIKEAIYHCDKCNKESYFELEAP